MTAIINSIATTVNYTDEQINDRFLEMLPLIRKTARIVFRKLNPDEREEACQNVEAWALYMLRQMAEQRRLEESKATPLAWYGIGRHREGRVFGTPSNTTDAMAEGTRACGRSKIKHYGYDTGSSMMDARNPVDEIVQFRMDFSDWYDNHSVRDQWIISDLAMGHTTNEVSKKYGYTAGRISQMRKSFYKSWTNLIDPPEAGMVVPA